MKKSEIDISQFKKVKRLNKGGFGIVYKVEEKKTGQFFAAKVIDCEDNEEKCNQMIQREISIMMYAKHPTIIKFIGYSKVDFQEENNITIIMELATNGSLNEVIAKIQENNGPINYTNTSRQIILIGVARGMKYLHDHDIIHRDLKTDNVLLDNNFHPHITDFGLSKFIESGHSSSQTTFGGTLVYEAPEILRNEKYNKKVDVYSYAILMYQVLTDCFPYPELEKDKMNGIGFILKIVQENYRPKFNVPIKKSFQNLIEKCWSNDPKERPTFDEIYSKLSALSDKIDEENDFLLDDVDINEVKMYVEDINDDPDTNDKNEKGKKVNEDEMEAEIKKLRSENELIYNKLKTNEEIINQLKLENDKQRNKNESLEADNKKLNDEINMTKQELNSAKNELSQTHNELKQKNEELIQTRNELDQTKEYLNQIKNELKQKNEELTQTRNELDQTKEDLNQTKNELKQKNEELIQTRNELNQTKEDLNQTNKALNEYKESNVVKVSQNKQIQSCIMVGGYNDYNNLGEEPNNLEGNSKIISPPIKIPLDSTTLLSLTTYADHSIIITNDHILKGIGMNKSCQLYNSFPQTTIDQFTPFTINDENGNQLTPLSAVSTQNGDLYMLSKSDGNGKLLMYNGLYGRQYYIDIDNHEPVALFGGYKNFAVICQEGEIIFFNYYYLYSGIKHFKSYSLPYDEKASSVACGDRTIFVLSTKGNVYRLSAVDFDKNDLQFIFVNELSNIEIVSLSGTYLHFFAVSKEGRVFAYGGNENGKLGLGPGKNSDSSFTQVQSLNDYVIKEAFAGMMHSLFITSDGMVLSCGTNNFGELLLDSRVEKFFYTPQESKIKEGATFCIAGQYTSIVFIGNCPTSMPNMKISNH